MDIKKANTAEGMELTIVGRLDIATSSWLLSTLTEALESSETIVLDLAGVDYVSSAGLRVLLKAQKLAQQTSKSMKLKNITPEAMEVFDITGFTGILTII